jgi:transposase
VARRRPDPKVAALQDARALNPHPEAVVDPQFAASEFLDARDLVQVKYEMVRRVRVDGASVSASAAAFGVSRPSWYAAAAALDERGLPGLLPDRPGPRRAHKLTDEVVGYLRGELAADPSLRSAELAARVAEQFGLRVHPRSIERALAREDGPKR